MNEGFHLQLKIKQIKELQRYKSLKSNENKKL